MLLLLMGEAETLFAHLNKGSHHRMAGIILYLNCRGCCSGSSYKREQVTWLAG